MGELQAADPSVLPLHISQSLLKVHCSFSTT